MREINPVEFETVSSTFDGGGHYQARVNADRTLLFRAITDRDGVFSEGWVETLNEVATPADLDWSEWMLSERYGSTPDFGRTDLIRLDGKTYVADLAEDVYLVGVEEGEPLPDSTFVPFESTTREGVRGVSIPWPKFPTLSDSVTLARTPNGDGEVTILVGVNSEDPEAAPEEGFAALTIPAAAWEHLRTLSAEAPAAVLA